MAESLEFSNRSSTALNDAQQEEVKKNLMVVKHMVLKSAYSKSSINMSKADLLAWQTATTASMGYGITKSPLKHKTIGYCTVSLAFEVKQNETIIASESDFQASSSVRRCPVFYTF